MSETIARREIERCSPELSGCEVMFLGAGMDSEAYLVNGTWVFRFPKREAVSRALAREIAVLPRLAGRLPVAVPRFEFVARQSGSGRLFAGYRHIPGEPLTPDLFETLPVDCQERILATLGAFLEGVHGFPIAEAAALGVEEFSTREWVATRWTYGRDAACSRLAPPGRAALARMTEDFLADARNFDYTPCLLYADFAPEHVLFDRDRGAIAGIVDWGDLAIGDPDFDLLYLHQDYGEGFVRRLLAHYPCPDPERLLAKLRVFEACDLIQTIAEAPAGASAASEIRAAADALGRLARQR